jgi:hypothetical protein
MQLENPNGFVAVSRQEKDLHWQPDDAILRLARALARQAAREDHEWEQRHYSKSTQPSGDLRTLLDRSSE